MAIVAQTNFWAIKGKVCYMYLFNFWCFLGKQLQFLEKTLKIRRQNKDLKYHRKSIVYF